jgi:DNA replication protein DnaC
MLRPVPEPPDDDQGQRCPAGVCDGSGWIVDEETDEARPCECRATRAKRSVSSRMGSGIPKRYRGVSFERKPIADLDPMVLRHVREYVRRIDQQLEEGRGLWFYGDVGTGKTSLAMLVSKAAMDSGHSVAIYSVPRLLAEIKETFDRDSAGSYMQLFRRLVSVDLLHLDDLGAERPTEWVLEQLYSIINERWQDGRSIVLTTNIQSLDELREQLGPRTVSRLAEICGDAVPLMGADLRMTSGG